ncbi:hypothetical protein BD414DRAFT_411913 [Trametes punicea]|nr:hypothetical protein BD414DRAFT_411913 [Trametes punicea]
MIVDDEDIPNHLPPATYTIIPPTRAGGNILLLPQHRHIRETIQAAIVRLENSLILDNAFPDAAARQQLVIKAMLDSSAHLGFGGLRTRLSADASFRRSLTSLPNQRISTFRSQVKKVTDAHCPPHYGLQAGSEDTLEKVEYQFSDLRYIYPSPYSNAIIQHTLRAAFWNVPSAVGYRIEDFFPSARRDRPDEKEIPMAMLALVGAVLHASLSEWSTGIHKKNTFSADAFLDAYNEHVTLLTGIKQKNVNGYHTMMHRLYIAARYVYSFTSFVPFRILT